MGNKKNDKQINYSHGPTQTKKTSWLMHSWSIFGAKTNHGQTWTHTTHHCPDLGEAITFPLIVFSVWPQGQHPNVILSQDSQVGSPKIPEIGTFTTLGAHNFVCRPSIEMSFKAKL